MLPWDVLILNLLLDTIWWNPGLFLHKQFYCLIKPDLHVKKNSQHIQGGQAKACSTQALSRAERGNEPGDEASL